MFTFPPVGDVVRRRLLLPLPLTLHITSRLKVSEFVALPTLSRALTYHVRVPQDRGLVGVTEVVPLGILSVSKVPSMKSWYLAKPDSESAEAVHLSVGLESPVFVLFAGTERVNAEGLALVV